MTLKIQQKELEQNYSPFALNLQPLQATKLSLGAKIRINAESQWSLRDWASGGKGHS